MEDQRSFWRQVYDDYCAKNVSKSTEELVDEFNELVQSEVYHQSVTARLTAITYLFHARGIDLSELRGENCLKLMMIRVRGNKVVPFF
jgi:lipase chaperone LimK